MKRLLILLCFSIFLISCSPKIYYYVDAKEAFIIEQPNAEGKVLKTLEKYNNLKFVEDNGGWLKVMHNKQIGFIQKSQVQKGKAISYTATYRTGAICKDGTSSSATGRGACSRHGGVRSWKTKKVEKIRIKEQSSNE